MRTQRTKLLGLLFAANVVTLIALWYIETGVRLVDRDADAIYPVPGSSTGNKTSTAHSNPKMGNLSCQAHGGPMDEEASEMVYWHDIPSDAQYQNPWKSSSTPQKYITFETDEGGWNNIRMSMETAFALALATGRSLVLPPAQSMFLLGANHSNQRNKFGFRDFFDLEHILNTDEHFIEIISTSEFLERVKLGRVLNKDFETPSIIPDNRTDWEGRPDVDRFCDWMRENFRTPNWPKTKCVTVVPANLSFSTKLVGDNHSYKVGDRNRLYLGKPVPVDAPSQRRLNEVLSHRMEICLYDEYHYKQSVLHFQGQNAIRLLTHFYLFVFSEEWKTDTWIKRFVRDRLKYSDEIQCVAARVIKAVRAKARQHNLTDEKGQFDTLHVRRGDFKVKHARIDAESIFDRVKMVVPSNATLYVATDERNKTFFDIFKQHYHVYYLDDFRDELGKINTNFYGLVEQLVSSKGRFFVGCFWSTFSGYINRLRGYHSQAQKAPGWKEGVLDSWYYVPDRKFDTMRRYGPAHIPMTAQEFAMGWRDINKGIA